MNMRLGVYTPPPGSTVVAFVTYDAAGCTGNIVSQGTVVLADNQCIPTNSFGATINSLRAAGLTSNAGTLTLCSSTDCSTGCSGTAVTSGVCTDSAALGGSGRFTWSPITTTTTTLTAAPTTAPSTSSNPCFHEDTVITYNGEDHRLQDLEHHEDCAIPHIVESRGTIITGECGKSRKLLRLTDGHLVYTQRGLQPAASVTTKDTLYADLGETQPCRVLSVTKEPTTQRYFGLNCYSSQVLADGLKTSTFEKLHSVPSFWMAIVGRVLGIHRASAIGDHIAELVSKLNLV